jgi:hypothetical protein
MNRLFKLFADGAVFTIFVVLDAIVVVTVAVTVYVAVAVHAAVAAAITAFVTFNAATAVAVVVLCCAHF